jgi:membrane protein implicated in regulation of membrane protease activity
LGFEISAVFWSPNAIRSHEQVDLTREMEVPPLMLLGIAGAIAWFGYRSFKKEAERVHEKVRRAEKEQSTGAAGTLIRDEKTGEYVVKKD